MHIIARCPTCKHKWHLKSSAADRRVLCERCGRLFKVPHLNEIPKAKQIIEKAQGRILVDKDGKTYG